MKKLSVVILLCMLTTQVIARDLSIGEEKIQPVHFPKFSVSGEYLANRKFHGFADEAMRGTVQSRFDVALSFEAGLLKYLNAGALFGTSVNDFKKPFHVRMGLFAKPQIPFTDRFALFSRIAVGIAVDIAPNSAALAHYTENVEDEEVQRVYKGQSYFGFPFGGFGSATIGLEYFLFSRLGLAFEWGIRATILHNRRDLPLMATAKDVSGAPKNFNFMLYETPFFMTLHWII